MSNVVLNKPATASNSFAPFLPTLAVDGNISQLKRWASSLPGAWLKVNMQDNYLVNRWRLYMMGCVGWTQNYNIRDFKLQGSLDDSNWFDIDSLTNNSANQIDRMINPIIAKYLRIYITKGLAINNQVSSIVNFDAFEPDNAGFLSALISSQGSFQPGFSQRVFSYSISVPNNVSSIAFTPTALQTNMGVSVKGILTTSGSQSGQIALAVGNNAIPVIVKSADGTIVTPYNINVSRASAASYLNSLVVINNRNQPVTLVPSFVKSTLNYTAVQASGITSVTVNPTAVDPAASLNVNGTPVPGGTSSGPINLQTGPNAISIVVNSTTSYSVLITKG